MESMYLTSFSIFTVSAADVESFGRVELRKRLVGRQRRSPTSKSVELINKIKRESITRK